jgi:tRNA(Ile2) C34 agmatinyltransferase TiaS
MCKLKFLQECREVINSRLKERGYECKVCGRDYLFSRIEDPNDVSRSLEECFGEGKKVCKIAKEVLTYTKLEQVIHYLDCINWQ